MKNLLIFLLLGSFLACNNGTESTEIKMDLIELQHHITMENEQTIFELVHRLSERDQSDREIDHDVITNVERGFQINRHARDLLFSYINDAKSGKATHTEEEMRDQLNQLQEESRIWREEMLVHPQP